MSDFISLMCPLCKEGIMFHESEPFPTMEQVKKRCGCQEEEEYES